MKMEKFNIKLPNQDLPETNYYPEGIEPVYIDKILKEIKEGKRLGSEFEASKVLNEKLSENPDLETIPFTGLIEYNNKLHKNAEIYAIGVPRQLENALDEARIDQLNIDSETKEKVKQQYDRFRNKNIAEVIVLLNA